jgi:hypothetical protein
LAARTSSSSAAGVALVFGALAVLAIPVGVVASEYAQDVRLLEALVVTVPAAFCLALIALGASRRARYRLERSVFRRRASAVRIGRFLAWAGIYLAITGALTIGVYELLRWAS